MLQVHLDVEITTLPQKSQPSQPTQKLQMTQQGKPYRVSKKGRINE